MFARWLVAVAIFVGCTRGERERSNERRIVSLTPSATQIVAALGATSQLVGVDDYSKDPPEVDKLPKVGSFLTPNLETIVSLKPTLVIVDDVHAGASGALHDAGLRTLECAMHDLDDVTKCLLAIGVAIDRSGQALEAIGAIDRAVAGVKKPAHHPRVLAVIDREEGGLGNIVAGGPGSWIDELMAIAGADNVLAKAGVRYPKISVEEVMQTKPELILDLSYSARSGMDVWKPYGKAIAITDQALLAPSPRVAQGLAVLANAIRETTAP